MSEEALPPLPRPSPGAKKPVPTPPSKGGCGGGTTQTPPGVQKPAGTAGKNPDDLSRQSTTQEKRMNQQNQLPPPELHLTPLNGAVRAQWREVPGAENYTLLARPDGSKQWMAAMDIITTEFLWTGLTNSLPYWFKVRANAGNVGGQYSFEMQATPNGPTVPSGQQSPQEQQQVRQNQPDQNQAQQTPATNEHRPRAVGLPVPDGDEDGMSTKSKIGIALAVLIILAIVYLILANAMELPPFAHATSTTRSERSIPIPAAAATNNVNPNERPFQIVHGPLVTVHNHPTGTITEYADSEYSTPPEPPSSQPEIKTPRPPIDISDRLSASEIVIRDEPKFVDIPPGKSVVLMLKNDRRVTTRSLARGTFTYQMIGDVKVSKKTGLPQGDGVKLISLKPRQTVRVFLEFEDQ